VQCHRRRFSNPDGADGTERSAALRDMVKPGVPAVTADNRLCADVGRFLQDLQGCAVIRRGDRVRGRAVAASFLDYLGCGGGQFPGQAGRVVAGADLGLVDSADAR
jgi:hypothetical protein